MKPSFSEYLASSRGSPHKIRLLFANCCKAAQVLSVNHNGVTKLALNRRTLKIRQTRPRKAYRVESAAARLDFFQR